jgi:RNA polymerase sigma factor (sigma-70 family)
MAPVPEEQLVDAATAGDEAAFTQLVERHRSELQAHAHRMLGSLEDAQDVLQEAFLRAWKGRATYRGQSTFRAWLYKITTNACLRILERRPRRLVPYDAIPAAEAGTGPQPPSELPWLQPYPDLLLDQGLEPEATMKFVVDLVLLEVRKPGPGLPLHEEAPVREPCPEQGAGGTTTRCRPTTTCACSWRRGRVPFRASKVSQRAQPAGGRKENQDGNDRHQRERLARRSRPGPGR